MLKHDSSVLKHVSMLKHTFSVLKHASKGIKRACNMLAVGKTCL